ncbi:GNAT family N-acetyltransferase [Kaistella montana]|uniref:GNAT family N-acetyltransferase n=1 Tax=Kaistella montana TaxID=1849733 RepID=A0ABW5K827_9FLAO|nr:GNAT family N-acetyltransferase [Kaistella montana]MCQ4034912.1 GNAT family N-acetyltransferase [Kaistella montana]
MDFKENYSLRKATTADQQDIWKILQQAIERRKQDGSSQWQNGYPNLETVQSDIENNYGYLLEIDGKIAAYAAIIFDIEPAYEEIEGNWLSNEPYVVIHRVAVSNEFAGKGVATHFFEEIEKIAKAQQVFSIKVDTNFDNISMLKILEKLGYTYCGEVYFRGSARKAFEKIICR